MNNAPQASAKSGQPRHTTVAGMWYLAAFAGLLVVAALLMRLLGKRRGCCQWMRVPQFSKVELEGIRTRHELERKRKQVSTLLRNGVGRAGATLEMYESNNKILNYAQALLWKCMIQITKY